jgi:RNA polymerase sigma-70 factor (ECF subfamily)
MPTSKMHLFNQGDPKIWNEMLDQFSARLFTAVNKMISNEEQAIEIVNDCFIKIYEKKPQFDSIQQLEAFLFKTAKHAAINFLKRDARDNKKAFLYTQLLDTSANIDVVADLEFEYRSLLDKIYYEIQQHPRERREVFELFHFHKKSALEIAAIKGIHISNVYKYKDTLLKALREKFGPDIDKLL